jgi:hypothetical protein
MPTSFWSHLRYFFTSFPFSTGIKLLEITKLKSIKGCDRAQAFSEALAVAKKAFD